MKGRRRRRNGAPSLESATEGGGVKVKKKEVESERKETFSLAFGSRQESLSHSSERDGGVASGGKNPEGGTRESLSIRSLHHDDDAAPMLLPGKKIVTAALSLPCVYVSPFWCLKPDIIKEAPSKEAERTERHSRVRGEVEKASGKKKKKQSIDVFHRSHPPLHHSPPSPPRWPFRARPSTRPPS